MKLNESATAPVTSVVTSASMVRSPSATPLISSRSFMIDACIWSRSARDCTRLMVLSSMTLSDRPMAPSSLWLGAGTRLERSPRSRAAQTSLRTPTSTAIGRTRKPARRTAIRRSPTPSTRTMRRAAAERTPSKAAVAVRNWSVAREATSALWRSSWPNASRAGVPRIDRGGAAGGDAGGCRPI